MVEANVMKLIAKMRGTSHACHGTGIGGRNCGRAGGGSGGSGGGPPFSISGGIGGLFPISGKEYHAPLIVGFLVNVLRMRFLGKKNVKLRGKFGQSCGQSKVFFFTFFSFSVFVFGKFVWSKTKRIPIKTRLENEKEISETKIKTTLKMKIIIYNIGYS